MRTFCMTISMLITMTTFHLGLVRQATAEEPATERPATMDELVGTWRMVDMQLMREFNRLDPFVLRHQRYVFASDGRMKVISSGTPFTRMLLDIFERREPQRSFQLDDNGVVTVLGQAWRSMNRFRATVVTSDEERGPQSGDLRLTWLNASGEPVAVKLLRRIAP